MQWTDQVVLNHFTTASIDRDNIEFYRGLLESQFLVNQCQKCRTWHHPPLPICPRCWSDRIVPTEVSGDARVFMSTVLYLGPAEDVVDYTAGYTLVTAELVEQEGLRISAPLVNRGDTGLGIGMAVRLTWIERDGHPLPAFEPASP
jgi:uncharacterized OB-fold protein